MFVNTEHLNLFIAGIRLLAKIVLLFSRQQYSVSGIEQEIRAATKSRPACVDGMHYLAYMEGMIYGSHVKLYGQLSQHGFSAGVTI